MTIDECKKSFIFYIDYADSFFSVMEDEEIGSLMRIICEYQKTGVEPRIENRVVKIAFSRIKRDLDINYKAWTEEKQRRKEAAKKGADARWHKNNAIECESHTTEYDTMPSMPVNVNVNDNVNVLEATVLNEPRFIDSDESISDRIVKEIKEKEEMKIKTRNKEDIYSKEFIEALPF